MKRCTGILFLTECENAVLLENGFGFGCGYTKDCDYQRPKNIISPTTRCPHFSKETDGIHCVVIGRCCHPNNEKW